MNFSSSLKEFNTFTPVVGWMFPKIHSYIEVLTPSVTVFGDRAFKEVISFNKVIRVGR